MRSSNHKLERLVFGLILCVGMLMSFEPLVRMHDPNGGQVGDAFDMRARLTQMESNLRIIATVKPSLNTGPSVVSVGETPAAAGPLAMPLGLRKASLAPWCVFAALAFCFLALVDLLGFQKVFAVFSLAGGCFAAIAVLHVMLMGSEVQFWTQDLMLRESLASTQDPGLGARILMANSFLISPGFGLYALTGCLFLVPVLSSTRAVPRLKAVLRHDPRVRVSQPVHIRPVNSQFPEETCTSLDLSRGGVLLESPSQHYYAGMEVYLTRNHHAGGPANPEEHGTVVRAQKMQNGGSRIAIQIIPET
jgi:PilZ domain